MVHKCTFCSVVEVTKNNRLEFFWALNKKRKKKNLKCHECLVVFVQILLNGIAIFYLFVKWHEKTKKNHTWLSLSLSLFISISWKNFLSHLLILGVKVLWVENCLCLDLSSIYFLFHCFFYGELLMHSRRQLRWVVM